MNQETINSRRRQWGRAVEILSGVISLGVVVGITAWTCMIALSAGVI